MTPFDKFKLMTIDELAEFIDENGMHDNTPWMNWWSEQYCDRCESILLEEDEVQSKLELTPFFNRTHECSYCEVYNKCKYFPELDDTPSMKDIVKIWLETDDE